MVNVNIKTTNGAKAKAARGGKTSAKQAKARATTLATKRTANLVTSGFVGAEKKFVDALSTSAAFAATWVRLNPTSLITGCISAPGQGDGEKERDGRVYHIQSVHCHGIVSMATLEAQTAPFADHEWRICLVWDTQTNGAQITGTSVMLATANDQTLAFRNLQNSKRFIVLWDSGNVIFKRDNQTNEGAIDSFATPQNKQSWSMNKTFKKGIKVRCIGTTADVASISDNSFSLIGVASTTSLNYTYATRVRFTG